MSTELAGNLEPSTVGDLIARHIATATGVDECGISYWDQEADKVFTYGYYPPDRRAAIEPAYALAEYPETRRVLTGGRSKIIHVADGDADPNEVRYLRSIATWSTVMLPLVAKGKAIGRSSSSRARRRLRRSPARLAQTMANEAAMALENARL